MTTTAKVTVQLEINADSSWGDDGCTVGQVKAQAASGIKNELQRLAGLSRYRIKLVGEPTVRILTFDAR
jgi:hypothetical protein